MRLPNQAKPVVRHANQMGAGVNPSFLGGILGGGGGGNPVTGAVDCVTAMSKCGSDWQCYLRNAPQCIGAATSIGSLIGSLF